MLTFWPFDHVSLERSFRLLLPPDTQRWGWSGHYLSEWPQQLLEVQREHCKATKKPLWKTDLRVFCGLGALSCFLVVRWFFILNTDSPSDPGSSWSSSIFQVWGRGTAFSLFAYCKVRIMSAQAFRSSLAAHLLNQQTLRTYFLLNVVLGSITQPLLQGWVCTVKTDWGIQGNKHCRKWEPGPAGPKENRKGSHQVIREGFKEETLLELALRRGLEAWQNSKRRWG